MAKKRIRSLEEVPEEVRSRLGNFFSDVDGNTFVVSGLPPELTGGLMARYSRAPTGLRLTLVNEFLDENGEPNQQKGTELMERVLNAFGDESVGELEGAHVGVEDVSQLMTKEIEDRRIGGSPIEQSTRYVKYDQKDSEGRWRYLRPKEVLNVGGELLEEFERVNDRAFEVYSDGVSRLSEHFKRVFPKNEFPVRVERNGEEVEVREHELIDEKEERAFRMAYNFTIRCAALDVGRCVLPSSTLTHLGVFGNGRFYTGLITALKSGPLEEAQERGYKLEEELNKQIPTFIKRNRVAEERSQRDSRMRTLAVKLFEGITPEAGYVDLRPRNDYFTEVLSSSLYPYTNLSLAQIEAVVGNLPTDKKREIFKEYIGERKSRRDRSGRGLEAGYPLTFDLVGGFAEYRDLERHRMLTQQRQLLTPDLGFIMPPEMVEVGLEQEVEEVVSMMGDLNAKMRAAGLETASQYATLFNHRLRFSMGMNLREFQHLGELRTQPAGHHSYRSMVMEMARKIDEMHPWANDAYGFVDYSDPGNKISRAKEQSRIAGKNITKGIDGSVDYQE